MSHRPISLHDLGQEATGRLRDCLDWLDENPWRAARHAGMFGVLLAIYAVYLTDFLHAAEAGSLEGNQVLRLGHLASFVAFSGWPFAAMRGLIPSWTIREAANVALTAFAAAAVIWLHRYGLQACLLGLAMLFAPLLVSAGIGHALGCLRDTVARRPEGAPPLHAGVERRVQTKSWESLMDERR
jgi:hypothetical protein